MQSTPHRVFIGYEPTEQLAYDVCRDSMLTHASDPLLVEPLNQAALRAAGLYRRTFYREGEQGFDAADGKPISTEFSFSRFLVPALCQWRGWALFCDSDMLWRDNVGRLFDMSTSGYAVMVVKHQHDPIEDVKMRQGQIQTRYHRKNWSSMVLWNCEHPANRALSPYQVNTMPGWWLHGFDWLTDGQIGGIPTQWNWLEGYSSCDVAPSVVHYTTGTPDVEGHEDAAYADEWNGYVKVAEAAE